MKNKENTVRKDEQELIDLLEKRIQASQKKLLVVGSGITSSHLGDERNLREFMMANFVTNTLRQQNINTEFYLFDDSYDPLNFRQLRVAVNKDEKLIEKFKDYCGTPIKLIPDPFECHPNYSLHFQSEILARFHSLDIYPNIIDSYSSYESGLYNEKKKKIFSNYKQIKSFLKKTFPGYTMRKIYWPLCPHCQKIDQTEITRISKDRVTVKCENCCYRFTDSVKDIKGKFSWKIDTAIRWNVFKIDFEPYSKAYLDPDVGSYFIAKKISEEFLDGYYPEIINYGQIIMDKSMSYKLLPSLPKEAFHAFLTQNRKKDIELTEKKILQFAHEYKVTPNLSFYDYILTKLPYDLFDHLQGNKIEPHYKKIMDHAVAFSKHFLNKEPYPTFPRKELLTELSPTTLLKIRKIFQWIILYKMENSEAQMEDFSKEFSTYLNENKYNKKFLFPIIRKLLSQEQSLPMIKIFYFAPNTYLYGCLLIIMQVFSSIKINKRNGKRVVVQKQGRVFIK